MNKIALKGFKHWSFSWKVTSAAVLATLPITLFVIFYISPLLERRLYDDRKQSLKQMVEIAQSIVTSYGERASKGECSVVEAQKSAIAALRNSRYNGKDYFFIQDLDCRIVMLPPKPEIEGTLRDQDKDSNGKLFRREIAETSKNENGGYVTYTFPRLGETTPLPKLVYVKLYKPWNWTIATGLYTDDLDKDMAVLQWVTLLAVLLGLPVAIAVGFFIGKNLRRSVKEVVERMDNADLNSNFGSDRMDEVGDLQRSFDHFLGSIKAILVQVSEATAAVASASSEISSSTEQMAAGAQEQTSQAGEVASAVEEMTRTIIENSKNASLTSETAKQAKAAAEQGGHVVEETVTGMKRIADFVKQSADTVQELGKSSDQIGEIISVIDDIADQTNLLALNAAIEAARAGEQGRGFAVVADEVRKLAERTTKATKEIAAMIKKIQSDTHGAVLSMNEGTTQVDAGIVLADKAGLSLKEIVGISQKVTDMINQIAAASEEQSSSSEQISKNVEGISKVTSETASGTQQIARAAEDLNRLTDNLQRLVEQFHLSDTGKPHQTDPSHIQKSGYEVRSNGKLVSHAM